LFLVIVLLCGTVPAPSSAQQKAPLSEAIRQAIDSKGIEKAKEHFVQLYETERTLYEVDMKEILTLVNNYVQNGKREAAGAVMEIAAPFIQDMMSGKLSNQLGDEMIAKLAEQERAEKEAESRKG